MPKRFIWLFANEADRRARNEKADMVTDPINTPLTDLVVKDRSYSIQRNVVGRSRLASPKIMGGLTQLEP